MLWIAALLLCLAAGWFLSGALGIGERLLRAPLAVLFGPGLASILFFLLAVAGLASPIPVLVTLAALAAAAWLASRKWPPLQTNSQPEPKTFPYNWILLLALAAGCLLLILNFHASSTANPHGEWDAAAIWNLRAKFLANSDTWRQAISSEPGSYMATSSHPGYPLFLSAFVAMQWTASGAFPAAVPLTTSLIICLALLAFLIASLAARASVALGLIAGLLLLATEWYSSQAAAQYSDLLLALAFLSALFLLSEAGQRTHPSALMSAGLAIGLAPWIKNEGLPFAIAALAVVAWRFKPQGLLWCAAGAAPGLLATAAVKILAEGRESMFPSSLADVLTRITDPGRVWQILFSFGKGIWEAGPFWANPVLLTLAIALVLRRRHLPAVWLLIPPAAALAADFGVFLLSMSDLSWHLSTSVTRLLLQLWPCLIWAIFSSLTPPEDYFSARR